MRERNKTFNQERRLLDVSETCSYLNLGRSKGIEFAKSVGAERKIGRRCLYDKKVLDAALDAMIE